MKRKHGSSKYSPEREEFDEDLLILLIAGGFAAALGYAIGGTIGFWVGAGIVLALAFTGLLFK